MVHSSGLNRVPTSALLAPTGIFLLAGVSNCCTAWILLVFVLAVLSDQLPRFAPSTRLGHVAPASSVDSVRVWALRYVTIRYDSIPMGLYGHCAAIVRCGVHVFLSLLRSCPFEVVGIKLAG